MQKEAFEATGLIPRSIIRTFERFLQQLLPGSETIAIQEYRLSRYQIRVSIKSLLQLICIPILVNYTIKPFFLRPIVQYVWDSRQEQLFLNHDQQKHAFRELHNFSETLFFDALLQEKETETDFASAFPTTLHPNTLAGEEKTASHHSASLSERDLSMQNKWQAMDPSFVEQNYWESNTLEAKKAYQLKTQEIAQRYNNQSILAITNVFGDLLTFITVSLLFVLMRTQLIILQSFVTEFIYSLSDTSKSFFLILGMDLLVGFHSPRAWELALQALLAHVGFPENENFILLFVALFPVFLDTVFKYWIFRYLNKISPSTVVTYHSMLE